MENKGKSKPPIEKSVKEINSRVTSRRQSQRNAAHIFQMKEYINRTQRSTVRKKEKRL